MAQGKIIDDVDIASNEFEVCKIGISDLWQSLKEGFDDFNAKPTIIAFLFVSYPLFALLLTLFLIGQNLLHLAFPMVAGFTLLGPVVLLGLFEMSRQRELGHEITLSSSFHFIHTNSFASIVALSVVMLMLYVAWVYMAEMIYFGLFSTVPPDSISEFITQVLSSRKGGALIFYGMGIGLMFAVIALAISVVSFPLILDKQVSAFTAVGTSVKAVGSNFVVMIVWGLIVTALLVAGTLVFLVGLAVVLPVLGHSTWHLYRKLVKP